MKIDKRSLAKKLIHRLQRAGIGITDNGYHDRYPVITLFHSSKSGLSNLAYNWHSYTSFLFSEHITNHYRYISIFELLGDVYDHEKEAADEIRAPLASLFNCKTAEELALKMEIIG